MVNRVRKGADVEVRRADHGEIAAFREEHRRSSQVGIEPLFLTRLVEEARPFIIEESAFGHETPTPMGYVLMLERPHAGHSHVTVVEIHLSPDKQSRYEDALDLIRNTYGPSVYLARTDDCRLNATLLARGHQVEAAALVMLYNYEGGSSPSDAGEGEAGVILTPLVFEHLAAVKRLIGERQTGVVYDNAVALGRPHSHQASDPAVAIAQMEALAREGESWVVLQHGRPVAVIARRGGGDGIHQLLDFAVARAGEADLSAALQRAGEAVSRDGFRPAAVIDATEVARRRIFRAAGYYSTAAYMVFYDSEIGRPSVGAVSLAELKAMIARGEKFRLVDILGEEHWREAHIPGSEWIDFRSLAKESRSRFGPEESIVVYCDGFT